MNRKIAMVKTINGEATVTIDTEQSHEVIDVPNGACMVLVKGEDGDTPEPTPEPDPDPFENRLRIGDIIAEMNNKLAEFGFKPISDGNTPNLYEYLLKAWDKADTEWKKQGSWMFSPETYRDLINLRGDEMTYIDIAYNSMHAWLMAMQLAELVPTLGTANINMQTKLFGLAYELGGGRAVPLYGLHIHADPMIARFAAGGCYVMTRCKYSFGDMDAMRNEIGGTVINASDWSGLGYMGADGQMQAVGYLVNSDIIIPSAAGPYANGCDDRVKPYEQGQPKEQFCLDGAIQNWYLDNYKSDLAVDDYAVTYLNIGAQTGLDIWEGYTHEEKKRILEAVAAPRATDHFFFGKKLVKFDGIHDGSRPGMFTNYSYFWFKEVSQAGIDVYEVAGPFADLYDKMFTGGGYGTPTDSLKFFDEVMKIADNSRYPTFHNQYGRRRPCGGTAGDSASARSEINGDPLNALYNVDISCIFADSKESADKWAQEDGFVNEKPKSYPSGHAAMTWTVAMMLGQMTGDESRLEQYETTAYQVGVNRTVARYHWNSDVIYGRLFGTMILPIINAMTGLRSSYEETKQRVNGEEPSDTVISINVCIENSKDEDVTLDGDLCLILANPTKNGEYIGWMGVYNRTPHIRFADGPVTIPAGGSKTFYGITYSEDADIMDGGGTVIDHRTIGLGGRSPLADALVADIGRQSNVLLYVGGDSEVAVCDCMDSSIIFENEGTYQIKVSS